MRVCLRFKLAGCAFCAQCQSFQLLRQCIGQSSILRWPAKQVVLMARALFHIGDLRLERCIFFARALPG